MQSYYDNMFNLDDKSALIISELLRGNDAISIDEYNHECEQYQEDHNFRYLILDSDKKMYKKNILEEIINEKELKETKKDDVELKIERTYVKVFSIIIGLFVVANVAQMLKCN